MNGVSKKLKKAEQPSVRIAACQPQEILGDINRSINEIERLTNVAQNHNADLMLFPECFVGGYHQDATLAQAAAIELSGEAFKRIEEQLAPLSPTIVFGLTEKADDRLFNTAVVLKNGKLICSYRKQHLLNNEAYFAPGLEQPVFELAGKKLGINICYDNRFSNAAKTMVKNGAQIILCPSNNMLPTNTAERYRELHNAGRAERAIEHQCWYISSDVTGERHDHKAYGPTSAINPSGKVVDQVRVGETGMIVVDI